MTPTTRKYPRTMQEAFGPHASRSLDFKPEPMHPHDKIVLAGSAVAFAFLVVWSLL